MNEPTLIKRLLMKIRKNFLRLKSFFPSPLPQGLSEFNKYVNTLIEAYSPPMSDRDVKFVVATLMMRLEPTDAYKPMRYFALALHKAAASQVSVHVMEQIKQEQNTEQLAALEKQKAEATAKLVEASNDKSIQD